MTHATGTTYLKPGVLPHMWCAGCGIGTMLGAMLRAFEELRLGRSDTVVVTGIGCTGKLDDYLVTNALHTTHGRALAYATGIKAFRPALKVVVVMGDGDGVTIGGNHFIHAARRNIDLTAIVLNNLNYGMTGGQASATSPSASITSTTAYGNPEREFDICALAEAAGANHVARTTTWHGWELQQTIREALTRTGFSLVEVMSPCPTQYGRRNDMQETAAMLLDLRDRAVPVERYRALAPAERGRCFPVGTLVDRREPGFVERYAQVQARAAQGH
ncbi:thiamine pyrophosphate-dependent enzyme [Ramlibacter sp.]|uniref:thiamine pyrophosphate-dependent enzyme n=1 Tax=Ramlibacter sp. TaxID=1917967 RepID=UPI002C42B604|nr:thiamine pyrophosphate-dependent enzyme [Ramlibacter sp.]HWI82987.1 thiamine pyrophosphate-dependent enzyme [Ramlibacter sp.]